MKNLMFFAFATIALFFTSCTKEQIEIPSSETTQVVKERNSETVSIACTLESYEIIIDDVTLAFTAPINLSTYTPVSTQTVLLKNLNTGAIVSINVAINSYEIIIDDVTLALTVPNVDFNNFEILDSQVLKFVE